MDSMVHVILQAAFFGRRQSITWRKMRNATMAPLGDGGSGEHDGKTWPALDKQVDVPHPGHCAHCRGRRVGRVAVYAFACIMFLIFFLVAFLLAFTTALTTPRAAGPLNCTVKAAPTGKDSAPAIRDAFKRCGKASTGHRNRILFTNTTYTISTVLDTTNLNNVDIELRGTLSWNNSNINYWLENSLPMGYQNQSTAWRLGGHGISFQGFGAGTFDGNGDVWYRFVNGQSNYPRRPHQLTITGTTDSTFEGLIFLQSQMWTMTVIHSSNILLQDIYVNNTSKSGVSLSF
jgi:galacturan 1,4-alpha-galacturonidase